MSLSVYLYVPIFIGVSGKLTILQILVFFDGVPKLVFTFNVGNVQKFQQVISCKMIKSYVFSRSVIKMFPCQC